MHCFGAHSQIPKRKCYTVAPSVWLSPPWQVGEFLGKTALRFKLRGACFLAAAGFKLPTDIHSPSNVG